MSSIKSLLTQVAELPPEEQEAAIQEAIASSKSSPAEISNEITSLFADLYGDGEAVTTEAVNQLELLGRIAESVDAQVQEAAERAQRAQEIGDRIEGLRQNVDTTDAAEKAAKDSVKDGVQGADSGGGDEGAKAPDEASKGPKIDTPDDAKPEGDKPGKEPAPDADAGSGGKDSGGGDKPPADPGGDAPDGEGEEEPKKKAAPAAKPPAVAAATSSSSRYSTGSVPAVNSDARVPLGQSNTDPAAAAEVQPWRPTYSLIAAADVPGFSTGQELEGGLADVARAWEGRMTPMITGQINNGRDGERTRVGIARIRRQIPQEFTVVDERDADDVIKHATNEKRLPGGSLTASAGWCAPSEQLYDLCDIRMTQEGLISLPQIATKRGGVKYPRDFDWAAAWSSIGFELTEEEVIAGREKQCVEVPCPTEWDECRMDVSGLCIRTPILMERGWPERVQQFFDGALIVHAHKLNAKKLAKMEALSQRIVIPGPALGANKGDPMVDPHGPGAVESMLSILELQVQYQRYHHRLSQSGGTLEGIFPFWMRGILKSDLRKKLGISDRWSITDSQVDTYLRSVGVNPQYVYDWQDSFEFPMNPSGFGGPIPMVWPDYLKFMLYPSGTFFELSDDVISMDGIYDHASLIQNVYTGLFTEEGWQVCKRCLDSYVIEMPLCPNGLSGGFREVECDERPPAPGDKDGVLCPA